MAKGRSLWSTEDSDSISEIHPLPRLTWFSRRQSGPKQQSEAVSRVPADIEGKRKPQASFPKYCQDVLQFLSHHILWLMEQRGRGDSIDLIHYGCGLHASYHMKSEV